MTAAEPAGGYARVRPPTYRTLVMLALLAGIVVLLLAAGGPLTPYLLGLIICFVLNPVVDRLQAVGLSRGLATIAVILAALVGVALLVWLVLDALLSQIAALVARWPDMSATLQDFLATTRLPGGVASAVSGWIAGLPDAMADLAPEIAQTILLAVGSGIVALISLAGLPFFIYYVLAERSGLITGAYHLLPAEYLVPARDIMAITNRTFAAWAKSQLLLSTSVGVPIFLAFSVLGLLVDPLYRDVAILFGVIAFFAEFVPIIGAYLAMVPAIVISLAGMGPIGALLTAGVFIAVQFVEGSVLVPRIQGDALNLPAAVVLVALVIGVALGGFLGVLIALPVTATIRAVVDYLYERAAGRSGETVAREPMPDGAEPG
ncbi:MAG TPA: AI-2E family transporter [Candidatus Limnocylindria bacterium]|nr:AI-2E family transporter [Candidatus Limnocylindria bacterium]